MQSTTKNRHASSAVLWGLLLGLRTAGALCASDHASTMAPADVTQERLESADREPGNWMSVGRTWDEQRFSPLRLINETNVSRLKIAWYADLNTYRGVDATPLEIDGVLYNISAWDITIAYEASTGKVLWPYDPKVPVEFARIACCGPVSRGRRGLARPDLHRSARRAPDRARRQDRRSPRGARTPSIRTSRFRLPGAPRIADGLW